MTRTCVFIPVAVSSLFVGACTNQQSEAPQSLARPGVILIIGDGMDDQQITIARNYLVGSSGRLVLDGLPFRAVAQIQTVAENDPTQPLYVADSANTATSMASGVVTSKGRIATTAQSDEDLTTIMELAHASGFGTGIVTTSSVTDATPASFVAHVNQRLCQGPSAMVRTNRRGRLSVDCSQDYKANGGLGSIAEQIAASNVDVVLGGGSRYFEQTIEGNTEMSVIDAASANGYQVIRERSELEQLIPGSKVLGLFSPNTMPVQLRGVNDAEAVTVERVDGEVRLPEPFACEPNPGFEAMPTLADMTHAALNELDDHDGFMLMIESASIDKQSHLRRPCGHVGELQQLDEVVGIALEYAQSHPETLILVTADHSHAAQIVEETGGPFIALNYASPGHFARLRTMEGGIMGINYATNDSPIQEGHTGAQVPVFASGQNVHDLPAFMQQVDIFHIAADHLGLSTAAPRE